MNSDKTMSVDIMEMDTRREGEWYITDESTSHMVEDSEGNMICMGELMVLSSSPWNTKSTINLYVPTNSETMGRIVECEHFSSRNYLSGVLITIINDNGALVPKISVTPLDYVTFIK